MMKKQRGLTLIEIMIALALGLFIIAATLTVYINTIKSSADTLKSARLNHDLGMAMSLMTNDIKRAGFWGGAVIGSTALLSNPFTTATTDIHIFNLAAPTTALTTSAGNCILYTYDGLINETSPPHLHDVSPFLPYTVPNNTVDAAEYYGFRLITANNVGSIQMRTTGSTTADCSDGNWERITDENTINITAVQFSFAPIGTLTGTSRCLDANSVVTDALTCSTYAAAASGVLFAQNRIVNIILTGQLIGADNAEVTKTLSDTVKVRNNRVFSKP